MQLARGKAQSISEAMAVGGDGEGQQALESVGIFEKESRVYAKVVCVGRSRSFPTPQPASAVRALGLLTSHCCKKAENSTPGSLPRLEEPKG